MNFPVASISCIVVGYCTLNGMHDIVPDIVVPHPRIDIISSTYYYIIRFQYRTVSIVK